MLKGPAIRKPGRGDGFFGKKYFVFTFGEKKNFIFYLGEKKYFVFHFGEKKKIFFNDFPIRSNVNMEKSSAIALCVKKK